mgnify:CR=1 FL=1
MKKIPFCTNFNYQALFLIVTHQTAAEIIYNRAVHTKEHMNLTSWKYSPDGKILETDVIIAKNYLKKEEFPFCTNFNYQALFLIIIYRNQIDILYLVLLYIF